MDDAQSPADLRLGGVPPSSAYWKSRKQGRSSRSLFRTAHLPVSSRQGPQEKIVSRWLRQGACRKGTNERSKASLWRRRRREDVIESLVAILACSLFAGAAIYINLVEHPARLSCGTEIAANEWVPSYKRATVMQASLAIVAGTTGVARWLETGGRFWLQGAILILAVVPVTFLIILPTNKRLLDPQRDRASEETRALLVTWGRLHAIRSVLSVVASVLYILAATQR
jgi:uncharacterized membrane protein